MFSKNGDGHSSGHKPGLQSWSLVGRLTLLVTLSTVGILLVATLYLFTSMGRNLDRENDEYLANEINLLRTILIRDTDNSETLREEVEWEGLAQTHLRYYARILDDQGNILLETPNMNEILPVKIFPSPVAVSQDPREGTRWKNGDRDSFLLESAWAQDSSRRMHLIQVAMDINRERMTLIHIRQSMTAVLVVGILFSIGICFIITRKGMQPLSDITEAIQKISAEQLHERIGPSPWPRELKTLAEAFDRMLDRLEDSFEKLSRFSADIAHELRTPVNSLMGTAEVALGKERTPEEYRQVIESSLEEYGRLARMIESLLFLARAENREIRIEKSWIEVHREMEKIREFYDALAEESGVEIICKGEARTFVEPVLFQRAVSNLIANALQYTPQGGSITLQTGQLPDQSVKVVVSDTGCGIPAEHQSRIFDRLYRIDPSRSPKQYGTGLGLAIVISIMELHGGSVTVSSEAGKGSVFTLIFPPVS